MSTDPDAWKRKYYAALAELEDKERAVAAAEELMRHGVARLSLIGNGLHPKLDRELENLRKAARGSTEATVIRRMIDQLSDTVRGLDLGAAQAGEELRAWLDDWLGELELPAGLGEEPARLRARLAKATGAEAVRALGAEAIELVRRGLATPGTAAPAASTPPGHAILLELLARLPAALARSDAAEQLRQRLRAATGDVTAETIAELARLLATAAAPAVPAPALAAARAAEDSSGRTLLKLLDHIDVPPAFQARAQQIRERLLTGADDWQQELDAVARLVADMNRQAQQEKSELEGFLRQLTERLGELDRHLQGAEHERQAALQSGRALDSAVMAQVSGIESSVRAAASLGDLKSAIQHRLDDIRQHLDRHREEEAQRQERLRTELQAVTARLHTVEQETVRLRTDLEERHRQALVDALTGVANRGAYEERISQEYAAWKRYRTPLALMVVDVDRFKQINDSYGHKAGDRALALIARVLKQALRETDLLARYGGEEFVIVLPHTATDALGGVAEKLRATVERANFQNSGVRVPVTVSVGYAAFRDDDTPEAVFERADRALYHAKQAGRNRCVAGDNTAPPAA